MPFIFIGLRAVSDILMFINMYFKVTCVMILIIAEVIWIMDSDYCVYDNITDFNKYLTPHSQCFIVCMNSFPPCLLNKCGRSTKCLICLLSAWTHCFLACLINV